VGLSRGREVGLRPRWAAGGGVVRTAGERAWAIAVVALLSVLAAVAPNNGSAPPAGRAGASAPAVVACSDSLPPLGLSGTLSVAGGPLGSSATVGVELNFTYFELYRTIVLGTGAIVGQGCAAEATTTTTGTNGTLRIGLSAPVGKCSSSPSGPECIQYLGAYGPIGVSVVGGLPAGYALSVEGAVAVLDLAFVYELAAVTIAPSGSTVTTSVGAPTFFSASAREGNGSASPIATQYSWSLNGTGWEFEGGANGPTAIVEAVPGAGVGTLEVRASANVDGIPLPTVGATAQMLAISTAIDSGQTNRTSLDAGGTVAIELAAEGAAGFTYQSTVRPGLGLAPTPAACSTGTSVGGEVPVSCSAVVRYPEAGLADPTANLTNGFSTADWTFPQLTISAPPALSVSPAAPTGYAGSPFDLELVAANGSGARPFTLACLASAAGAPACEAAPGPRWAFSPVFPVPGSYPALAWARDAVGANASLAFEVTVVGPLELGPIEIPTTNASVGSPLTLEASIAGGAGPLRYWWNASGEPGSFASGEAPSDGNVTATLVPSAAGPLEVTLSVVDRLGTVVGRTLLLSVGTAPAARIAAFGGAPAGSVTAGKPVRLAWAAYDRLGTLDRTFGANLELSLSIGNGTPLAWVNASGAGPLEAIDPGTYGVPSSAWIEGILNLTVTIGSAATVTAQLHGTGLPAGVAAATFTVVPDRDHVRLFDPQVRDRGGRTNATLWRVEDRFGNSAPGALLTVELSLVGELSDQVVVAIPLPGGGSGVWINYSAPGPEAGELLVVDAAGQSVLGPYPLPALGAPASDATTVDAVAAAVPIGVVGLAVLAVARRRRRGRAGAADTELRDLAEGRARALALVESAGEIDLPGLEAAWEPPPAPPALADWLASLLADGTLGATVGEDGRARFCLASGRAHGPRVTLDPEALARSLRQRESETDEATYAEDGP
jgi:hypothetical protein